MCALQFQRGATPGQQGASTQHVRALQTDAGERREACETSRGEEPTRIGGTHALVLPFWKCRWLTSRLQRSSRVGKRAGCKRNRAQFSARTTKIRAQFSARTTKNLARFRARMPLGIRAQSSTRTKQDLGTILWAIDENLGTNLQVFQLSKRKKKNMYT